MTVFRERVSIEDVAGVVEAFNDGVVVSTGDDVSSSEYEAMLDTFPAMAPAIRSLTEGNESPAMVASAIEFLLEGLHLSKRLNKDAVGQRADYRSRR